MTVYRGLACAGLLALLSACAPGRSDPVGIDGSGAARSVEEHFSGRVQPNLDFCRSCHVPGGVADVEDGREFMLAMDESQDMENLRQSWERLGGNNPTSRILLMSSGQETPHTGGAPWAVDSAAYRNMAILLQCFENPSDCGLAGGVDGGELLPLLGSSRGGHRWFDYCADKKDDAELPVDPRSLVQPGFNDGKAVYYNAWWKDCHSDPELVGEAAHPKTCGELRQSQRQGAILMEGKGAVGAGNFFAANSEGSALALDAEDYNKLWQVWGLSERPDNFDELVLERFGVARSYDRNPYPLPGEDPNDPEVDGGSGQLPAAMTQTRTPDGKWTGRVSLNCNLCHSGQIGTPADGPGLGLVYGSGNSNADVAASGRDLGVAGAPVNALVALFSTQRGTNNAAFFNIAALGGIQPDLSLLGILRSGSNASGDTPAWWNVGHRPLKFWNGSFSSDAVRVDLAFFFPLGSGDSEPFVRAHAQHADHWVLSLKAPAYPMPVDTALAEQGAILFHSKDLWAEGLDNPAEKPAGGNGSCASCHGAYSPRFVHDKAYLADPALEGIASYVVPREVIRTDFARADTDNEGVSQALSRTFIGYPETAGLGADKDCGTQTRAAARAGRGHGYLAPPLYGTWATAPYLHNGSIPDVWTLLKPEDRPKLWRRVSTPARPDQKGKVVMGFDTNLGRAYDQKNLGWKYEVLSCGTGTIPFLDCDPLMPDQDPAALALLNTLYGNLIALWNVGNVVSLLQFTPQQNEDRKIYNTHMYSQGNEGHDFTAVLTDAERRALIEYLKTL